MDALVPDVRTWRPLPVLNIIDTTLLFVLRAIFLLRDTGICITEHFFHSVLAPKYLSFHHMCVCTMHTYTRTSFCLTGSYDFDPLRTASSDLNQQSIDPVYDLLRKAVDAGRRTGQAGGSVISSHDKPYSSTADRNWSQVIGQMGILPPHHHPRARSSASSSGSSSCASAAHLLSVLNNPHSSSSGNCFHMLILIHPFLLSLSVYQGKDEVKYDSSFPSLSSN